MRKIELKDNLTPRQFLAWRMRFHYGWRLKKIALELGLSQSGASRLIATAMRRAGLPKYRLSVIRTKPREVRAISLSEVVGEI